MVTKEVKARVRERAGGLCEDCKSSGDWRGLSFHEWPPKRMGGTHHIYTEDEVRLLCYRCHSKRHGLREVNGTRIYT